MFSCRHCVGRVLVDGHDLRMTNPSFTTIAEGVEMGVLRRHEGQGMTFLIRMQPGSRAPRHNHPGGEETYMLEGRLRICERVSAGGEAEPDLVLAAGEYGFVPPGEKHEGIAEGVTRFLVVAPAGVSRT